MQLVGCLVSAVSYLVRAVVSWLLNWLVSYLVSAVGWPFSWCG